MHMRNVYLIFTKTHHFCEYGFSVSALWCPLATPTVLLGFLLPWAWSISSRLLQQSTATAPYLGRGVSPQRCPFWPCMWSEHETRVNHKYLSQALKWRSGSMVPQACHLMLGRDRYLKEQHLEKRHTLWKTLKQANACCVQWSEGKWMSVAEQAR